MPQISVMRRLLRKDLFGGKRVTFLVLVMRMKQCGIHFGIYCVGREKNVIIG